MKETSLETGAKIFAIIAMTVVFLTGVNIAYHKIFKTQETLGVVVERVNVKHNQKLLIIQVGDFVFEEWVGLEEYIKYQVGDKLAVEYYQPIGTRKIFSIKGEEIRKAKTP